MLPIGTDPTLHGAGFGIVATRSMHRHMWRPQHLGRLVPVPGDAVFALGGEELGPGNHLRVLLEQRSPLAFGHATPDAKLHLVVESVGGALGEDGTVSANRSRFS